MFARSKWSKQIIPVEGYYFDSLYINQNKDSIRLQSWCLTPIILGLTGEERIGQIDFQSISGTRALEQQVAELTARLAKLEGK